MRLKIQRNLLFKKCRLVALILATSENGSVRPVIFVVQFASDAGGPKYLFWIALDGAKLESPLTDSALGGGVGDG